MESVTEIKREVNVPVDVLTGYGYDVLCLTLGRINPYGREPVKGEADVPALMLTLGSIIGYLHQKLHNHITPEHETYLIQTLIIPDLHDRFPDEAYINEHTIKTILNKLTTGWETFNFDISIRIRTITPTKPHPISFVLPMLIIYYATLRQYETSETLWKEWYTTVIQKTNTNNVAQTSKQPI